MACSACASKNAKVTYLHTASDGTKTVYKSESEARAAKIRKGGDYKPQ